MVEHGLWDILLGEVNRQLEAKHIIIPVNAHDTTQPEFFVTSADLEHPSLHGLDGAEAMLYWNKLEDLMGGFYAGKTGRPSYPLLILLRASLLGIWYCLSDVELA